MKKKPKFEYTADDSCNEKEQEMPKKRKELNKLERVKENFRKHQEKSKQIYGEEAR